MLSNIIIIILFFTMDRFESNLLRHKRILRDAINSISITTLNSHLRLEEYLHGDKKEYEKIDLNIQKSLKTVDILLNGGEYTIYGVYDNNFYFDHKNNSLELKTYLLDIQNSIIELKKAKDDRLKAKNIIKSDLIYDKYFQHSVDKINIVRKYTSKKFIENYNTYNNIKMAIYILITLVLVSFLSLIFIFKKDIQQRIKISITDPLTKAKNRKAYQEDLKKLFNHFKRYQNPFCMILLDIDNFKQINDTYGHDIGDKVLVELTQLAQANIREDLDNFYRIGGEEFVLLCDNTSLQGGIQVAEKLRKTIGDKLKTIENRQITVSIGVSEITTQDDTSDIYKRADKYLYISKLNGKNQVTHDKI